MNQLYVGCPELLQPRSRVWSKLLMHVIACAHIDDPEQRADAASLAAVFQTSLDPDTVKL